VPEVVVQQVGRSYSAGIAADIAVDEVGGTAEEELGIVEEEGVFDIVVAEVGKGDVDSSHHEGLMRDTLAGNPGYRIEPHS
jgi:hypothetical protein